MKFKLLSIIVIALPLTFSTTLANERKMDLNINSSYKTLPDDVLKKYPITTVEKAKENYEEEFQQKIQLPKELTEKLPFDVSKSTGRIDPRANEKILELKYFNDRDIFQVVVYPSTNGLQQDPGEKVVEFKDGTKSLYRKGTNVNNVYLLRFQKNQWDYQFIFIMNSYKEIHLSDFETLVVAEWE